MANCNYAITLEFYICVEAHKFMGVFQGVCDEDPPTTNIGYVLNIQLILMLVLLQAIGIFNRITNS